MNKLLATLVIGLFAAVSAAGAATLPSKHAHARHQSKASAHAKAHHGHKHMTKAHSIKGQRKMALHQGHKHLARKA